MNVKINIIIVIVNIAKIKIDINVRIFKIIIIKQEKIKDNFQTNLLKKKTIRILQIIISNINREHQEFVDSQKIITQLKLKQLYLLMIKKINFVKNGKVKNHIKIKN